VLATTAVGSIFALKLCAPTPSPLQARPRARAPHPLLRPVGVHVDVALVHDLVADDLLNNIFQGYEPREHLDSARAAPVASRGPVLNGHGHQLRGEQHVAVGRLELQGGEEGFGGKVYGLLIY
jgi:hypothetical protein